MSGATGREARIKVMIAGLGPHATKCHLPFLRRNADRLQLVAVVEISSKVEETRSALSVVDEDVEVVAVEPWSGATMPAPVADRLTEVAKRLGVDAVLVATEPLAHGAYMTWAVEVASVFVDKPIVLHEDSANDAAVARRLQTDIHSMLADLELTPDVFIAVGTQRRYHPGLTLMNRLVTDAAARFGTPVTSLTSTHADGQFRYPHEVASFRYHGFDQGYGKLGHSGFHIVSTQADLIQQSCIAAGVALDGFTTTASAVRPAGFLQQVPRAAYERHFGADVWAVESPQEHAELAARMARYGEMDVAVTTTFFLDGTPTVLGQINLAHTSVSRRSALRSAADLYKGNGRVKHEYHSVNVGPFMNVQLHSYQSRARHDVNGARERVLGGNDSMEVHVYRNADWFEPGTPEFEIYTGDMIAAQAGVPNGIGFTQFAKDRMLADFFDVLGGSTPVSSHRSLLGSHVLGTGMLSASFESVAVGDTVCRRLDAGLFAKDAR